MSENGMSQEAIEATIAASLERSNSLNLGSPTRTLHLTAAEQSSRDNTPTPVSLDDLARRPRSNPRSRTPMRYESPLESNALRSPSPVHEESQRVNIRPLVAGRPVGAAHHGRFTIHEHGNDTPKSAKQGPSHRKLRRWNNDKFSGLAAEIGSKAAAVWTKAQADAHLYRDIYDPKEHCQSDKISKFLNDPSMKRAREEFFEGSGPTNAISVYGRHQPKLATTATERLRLVEPRLQSLVERAYRNSAPAAKVVEMLEEFLVASLHQRSTETLNDKWWSNLLLEAPTILHRQDRFIMQFFFPSVTPTGGFHRLLLHAIAQFHGLKPVAKMVYSPEKARALIVSGGLHGSDTFRLVDVLKDME